MISKKLLLKAFTLILSVFVVMSLFTGCNKDKTPQSSETEGTGTQNTTKKKDVTLTIWHYLNDREALLKDLAAEYEEMTGVKVDLQLYSGDQMANKVQSAAQAKTLPDSWVFVGGKGDICRYSEAGNIMDLDGAMKDWSSRFNQVILDQVTVTEEDIKIEEYKNAPLGVYGIPLDVNNMQFLYNKDLFTQAGLNPENPPKTWAEFLEVGTALKAAGIIPFATGVGSWVHFSLASMYQFAYADTQTITDARLGNITYEEMGMEKVLNLFEEMRTAKMFADGIATMDLPTAEQMFVNGQVAMIYDGSWAIGVFNSMNPEFKNYGVFFPPKDERAPNEPLIPGGIGAYLVVNKDSEHPDETVAFLKWLTDNEQQVRYANESFNLPANKDCLDPTKLTPQTAEFANDMDKIQPSVPGEKAEVGEVYGKGMQMITIGEKTPTDVVKEMDEKN